MRFRLSLIALVIAFLFTWFAPAIELPETAKLVPPETILLLDIKDFSKFTLEFEKTSLHRLTEDPSMQPFIEHAKTKWYDMIKSLDDNNIFRIFVDKQITPSGRLAAVFVVGKNNIDANEPPMTIISQWGKDVDKLKEIIENIMKKNIEAGGRNKPIESFMGVDIQSAIDEGDTEFAQCFIDDVFICGTDLETIKFIVSQVKGSSKASLASSPDYNNTVRATGINKEASVYLNLRQWINVELSLDTDGVAKEKLSQFGIDNIAGIAVSVDLAPDNKTPYVLKGLLKINGSKKGFMKMLDVKSSPFRVPNFVPRECARVSALNLDIQGMFHEITAILSEVNPMFASMLYSPLLPATPDGQPARTIKEAIFDHMGSEIFVIQSVKRPFSDNAIPFEYMVAAATTNRNALESALAALHNQFIRSYDPDSKKQMLGHTLYLIKANNLPLFSNPGTKPLAAVESESRMDFPNFAFTVTDTHLIAGFESSVESAIRTLDNNQSIAGAKWFRQAKSNLPDAIGAASVENNRDTVEYLWWLLKKTQSAPGQAAAASPTMSYLIHDFDLDFSLLPDFKDIKKYLGLSAGYIISNEDGFYMESKLIDQTD